eukprot:1156437-Pelagomonas_calceolata.AAC.11
MVPYGTTMIDMVRFGKKNKEEHVRQNRPVEPHHHHHKHHQHCPLTMDGMPTLKSLSTRT